MDLPNVVIAVTGAATLVYSVGANVIDEGRLGRAYRRMERVVGLSSVADELAEKEASPELAVALDEARRRLAKRIARLEILKLTKPLYRRGLVQFGLFVYALLVADVWTDAELGPWTLPFYRHTVFDLRNTIFEDHNWPNWLRWFSYAFTLLFPLYFVVPALRQRSREAGERAKDLLDRRNSAASLQTSNDAGASTTVENQGADDSPDAAPPPGSGPSATAEPLSPIQELEQRT